MNGLRGLFHRIRLHLGHRRFPTERNSASAGASHARIVVYTAQIGLRDAPPLPPPSLGDCQPICFTDNPEIQAPGWQIRLVDDTLGLSPRRFARRLKLLPQTFLPDADWWIWQDSNLQLNASPEALVGECGSCEIAAFCHPERRCTFQEADAVKWLRLDDELIVDEQMRLYLELGFPPNFGLLETALLVRRNSSAIRRLNESWYAQVSCGSQRDQLSIMPCLWQAQLPWHELSGCREDNPYALFTG